MAFIADPITIETLRSCVGARLESATVDEMAMLGTDDSPIFTHPRLNFVQATVLELALSGGRFVRIVTSQQDDDWNLLVRERGAEAGWPPLGGTIWRRRTLDELPGGVINAVDWSDDLQLISFSIGDLTIHLKAGEVYEGLNGEVRVAERDESVLIFLNDEALAATSFNQSLVP